LQQAPPGREYAVAAARAARDVDVGGFGLRGGMTLRCWVHQVQKDWGWAHRRLLAVPVSGMIGCR
jgi:hypothetical protein